MWKNGSDVKIELPVDDPTARKRDRENSGNGSEESIHEPEW